MTKEKQINNDLWNEMDLVDNSSELPASPYVKDLESMLLPSAEEFDSPPTRNRSIEQKPDNILGQRSQSDKATSQNLPKPGINLSMFPPVPDEVNSASDVFPFDSHSQTETVENSETNKNESAELNEKKISPKRKPMVGPLPIPEGGYTKPIKYRSSFKAFYPHLAIVVLCSVIAVFPSIGTLLFSTEDMSKMPSWIQEHFQMIIKIISALVGLFIIVLISKQKSAGVIKAYGDHLEYKKGMMKPITIHYADIRTIDVQHCLATFYAPIGNFHVISSQQHVVMPNLLEPFILKDAIEKRRTELKNQI